MSKGATPAAAPDDSARGARIIARTVELIGQGLGWSKAMSQARDELEAHERRAHDRRAQPAEPAGV